jgi:hypothetical protein
MVGRDLILEFEFNFGNIGRVPTAHQIPYHAIPRLAFEKLRDAPEWDWQAIQHNRNIERDKERWRRMLIDIEKQAMDYALDMIRQNATCRKESFFGGMEEFGYKVRT